MSQTPSSYDLIVGEYAERIDNADELLGELPEGFHDESNLSKFSSIPNEVDVWGRISGKVKVRQFCVSELIYIYVCIYSLCI